MPHSVDTASSQPAETTARRNLQKGHHTRAMLLDAALSRASQLGLEGITIGALAQMVDMSKSGVFAHFGSREDLQIAIVDEYYRRFEATVFQPALALPRGLPRVRAMFENWIHLVATEEVQSGCIFISGAVDFDDREGPVRTALQLAIDTWLQALVRAIEQAVQEGHLHADTDPHQMVFEVHGLILSAHYEVRFLHRPGASERIQRGFERIVRQFAV